MVRVPVPEPVPVISSPHIPGTGRFFSHFQLSSTAGTGKYSVIFSFRYSRCWQVLSICSASSTSGTGRYSVIFNLKYSRYWHVLKSSSALRTPGTGRYSKHLRPLSTPGTGRYSSDDKREVLQVLESSQSFSASSTPGTGKYSVMFSFKHSGY